jgi:hypothetical protein
MNCRAVRQAAFPPTVADWPHESRDARPCDPNSVGGLQIPSDADFADLADWIHAIRAIRGQRLSFQ